MENKVRKRGRKKLAVKKGKAITFRVTEEFNNYLKKIADLDEKSIANLITTSVMEYGKTWYGEEYTPILRSETQGKHEAYKDYWRKDEDNLGNEENEGKKDGNEQ